jgi:group I intron endonuclease
MVRGSVYLLTNTHTGEQYVGQTIQTVAKRWYNHRIAAKRPRFPVAINIAIYGAEVFTVQELFVAFGKQNLDYAEKLFIKELRPTLNRTNGGAGSSRKITEEERRKRSEAAKLRWSNPKWREKTIESLRVANRNLPPKDVLSRIGIEGAKKRWAGHCKKEKEIKNKSLSIANSWKNLETRQKRIEGLRKTLSKPEVRAKYSLASTGRKQTKTAIEKTAKSKWKPVYCPELKFSFLNQKYAAEFFNVLPTAISNAIKNKGRVQHKFTLLRVV